MVLMRSIFPGFNRQISLPNGWGVGGAISTQQFTDEDANTVYADLSHQPLLQSVIHPSPHQSPVWEAVFPRGAPFIQHISHILDLTGGFSTVWERRFHSTTRTAVRKAERSNLTVEIDSTGKLNRVFYDMFNDWSIRRGRDRHLPTWLARWSNQHREPFSRFEQISARMGDACRIYVASLDSQPVAASILLVFGNDAFFYRGTSLRELANPVRANDLLQCMMIQAACEAGCRYYHMGESGGVESLMRFKSGFGAVPTPFREYSIERLPITAASIQKNRLMKGVEHLLLRSS